MDPVRQERLQALYTDAWISRLKAFVGRRYHDFGDWEGWFEEAHQNLALKIDKLPLNQEITDALIFAVFKNELISVKRNRLGYPRPRLWLRQYSQLGQDLFEWMCLQRLPRQQVINHALRKLGNSDYESSVMQSVENKHSQTDRIPGEQREQREQQEQREDSTSHFQQLLIRLTDTMISKRECEGVRPSVEDIDDEAVGQIAEDAPTTEENTDHAQVSLFLSMILEQSDISKRQQRQATSRFETLRQTLTEDRVLDDIDILILRCYYFQGLSQNEVAKLLGRPIQQVVRKREAAIGRIREVLEQQGLSKEALL